MRVLVTGGRVFDSRDLLIEAMDRLHEECGITTLIHGAAKGADTLAGGWAESRGIEVIACPADWRRYHRAAGPIRNKQMLVEHKPDLVVAFPGSTGTAHMVAIAEKAGVEVIRIQQLPDGLQTPDSGVAPHAHGRQIAAHGGCPLMAR
jgi:hypothetical protein